MKKIIVKTAVKTVLIVLGVLVVIFAIFNFGFPQYMATMFENLGNYTIAVEYASTTYDRSGNVNDLARCVDDSILSHKDSYIVKFGEKLINHDKFEEVCERKDGSIADMNYRQFICGKVAVAAYNEGDFDKAESIATAAIDQGTFVSGNAVIALAGRIVEKKDATNALKLSNTLEGLREGLSADGDRILLDEVIEILNNVQ